MSFSEVNMTQATVMEIPYVMAFPIFNTSIERMTTVIQVGFAHFNSPVK